MADRLPPLNALRAFEVAARSGSFTVAARELGRTHGAVSRQVKLLEQDLGVELFQRSGKGLRLTSEGLALSMSLQAAFETIGTAIAGLKPAKSAKREEQRIVRLTTFSSIAARWLAPRLARFAKAYPGVDVRINVTERVVEFGPGRADIAILSGRGRWGASYAERLFPPVLVPVCAPSLAARVLKTPADLAHVRLIHNASFADWERWFGAAKLKPASARAGFVFDDYNVILQTAVEGGGAALVPQPLVIDDLAAGRVAQPFARTIEAEFAYYLVCPKSNLEDPATSQFAQWIVAEARLSLSRDAVR